MTKPITNEPTHTETNAEGVDKVRPGAVDLTGDITPATVEEAEQAWSDHYADAKHRNRFSAQLPHISEPYAPLENLMVQAYGRFGNMAPETMPGNIKTILLPYANKIVEDIRIHPYASLPDLDYYRALSDIRPIPDEIMISGLAYWYAFWMSSDKAKGFGADYLRTMNQILYQRKYGSGRIEMATVDKEAETQ